MVGKVGNSAVGCSNVGVGISIAPGIVNASGRVMEGKSGSSPIYLINNLVDAIARPTLTLGFPAVVDNTPLSLT